ncbi:flagellar biosynthesis anti-sigma factor FlgM [Halomonas beimenensis]|uniref:Negative regulator of flagellin synthesis n=1 Tax=Halomonas beimenensis TaxID=475662 RepID=A0A291PCT1_9GAMM|nr:flagellar biosynthesis anti-sigma factor FlgM [Halomonas beimenensis]ATJ84690.1 negative regulator of flagellin synthesis FlgM (anti-sigma28) [Halomonas beimenensis]
MKVDNHQPLRSGQLEQRQPARKPDGSEAPTKDAGSPAAMTHLSQGAANASQDIDAARVAEVRDAIREGRLEIKPDRIADGLIDSVKDLLAQGGNRE